ncbi:MAG TPA: chromosome segregation protein SMC [Candidatus Saccharimonadales bacterium]|nr:chromosome segregation protein SMC [Candidatus Saccharimonadales bacterium]
MLKLRKVEIVGFKSFCERTAVTFSGTGTTCIVGPNGCGKSNVVDAISWVLGEQSHKSLRAERMADCIFNGTAKRPPMGLAEVTITLEDPELAEAARFVLESASNAESPAPSAEFEAGAESVDPATAEAEAGTAAAGESAGATSESSEAAPVSNEPAFLAKKKKRAEKPAISTKPGEVVVSRRLYRSGQSEYLINGRVARLRDIQEMFMGVGLGPDSYAIIEQGRIGQILATKPMERRAIIEEAAGVTKFKTKKRLSEAKLESSKVNLSRVNDIVVEVEKQLGSLKRQAAKARRYSEIREQMRGIVRQMLAGKARELDAESERVNVRLAELTASETQYAQAIHEQEAEQDRLSQRIYSLDGEMRQNQNVLNQTALEVDRCENRITFNRTRSEELAGRNSQLTAERQSIDGQRLEWQFRNHAQQQAVEAARTESVTVGTRVEELNHRAAFRTTQISEAETRVEALRRAATEASESVLRLHGEQKQAEEALVHQSESLHKLEAREAELLESSIRIRDGAEQAATAWQDANGHVEMLQQRSVALQARLVELRQNRECTTKEADSLRDSLAGLRARHSTLNRILNDHSYTGEAVQKLFAANERNGGQDFRAVGVLADYAEVQEQHEAAIEQYLREELEYVVVETYDHARAGVHMLREEVGGRATFFVDSLRNLKLDEYEPIVHFRSEDGVISRLDKLVEFRDPLGPAAKQFLPRLRYGYLTDSTAAEKLAREYPQYAFVTPEGTCYQGRMVTGGRPDEAGPLGMKRELRAVSAELTHLEERSTTVQSELEAINTEVRDIETSQQELAAQLREAERNLFAAKHRHEQTQSDLARLGLELTTCQNDLARIRQEIDSVKLRAQNAQLQHQAAASTRAEAEAESLRLTAEVAQLRTFVEAERNELATAKAELAAMNERLASAEAIAHRLQEESADLDRREVALRQQESSISEETTAMARQTEELTQQLEVLRIEKVRLEARQKELEQEWDSARNTVTAAEDHLRTARQTLQEMRDERGKFEIEKARNDSDRQHLRETCLAEVNAQPEDLIAGEAVFMTGEELATAEGSYREMKQRIENMGAVNMMALEEYNECEQRFTFLTRERDDLIQAIADTQQAIKELDLITREKFEQAFASINANFTSAFHTIFGGGTAEMRLTEPDSSGEAGIDIVASPPGKRLQNVLLLSGGEKAMTALALLIAIFRYQPSPFCILDEVDAPLDEANVGRFTRLIGDMSANTQFIVVTHNRKTMETGSVLYGVTMQEPGVSKLVSVRWEGQEVPEPKQRAASAA